MLPLEARIRKTVAGYRSELAKLTKELVRIPTENPPGRNYRACAESLARRMRELGLRAKAEKIPSPESARAKGAGGTKPEPRYWVHASYGNGKRAIYFHGHYDVVPASSAGQFEPQERNGCIFGRGAGDMKGGLVSMLFAVRALADLKIELRGRVELVFVPDEETGGALGTAALAENDMIGRDGIGMLTAEPTGGVIWNASRGAISMRVKVKGRPAHVGLSYRGVNAFEKMLEVARALEKEKRRVSRRKTRFHIAPEAARRSILLMGGRSEGGTNFNTVPAECSFTVDRRINPEENLGAEKKRLLQILGRLRRTGIELDTEILQEGGCAGVPETHAFARMIGRAVRDVTGRAPAFELCPGLLETRFYAARGVPALAYGPGLLSVAHGPNEYVSMREMEKCAAIYALTAAQLLAKEKGS
ncbi:MAG TPA: M20 family metallopeptidase [Candidatus Limnocylindrales bacterium]|nr:M20 family metallopeptidase [Candidatus Limnocylindrales bacterium]